MKKASEYATEFKANPTEKTLHGIAQAFMDEIKEIAAMRNTTNNVAILSILDEQDRKWRAFSRRVEGIKPDGFDGLVKLIQPEVHAHWRKIGQIK